MPKVRLVDSDGSQVGIKTRDEALEYAFSKNLDLVEVAANADPPVCRIMDYGKYKYEQEQKAKTARKHQVSINVKEIKLRPKIGVHDYETKKGHVIRFLKQRAKVKVTIMFRGREQSHPERGRDLLMRLAEDVKEIGQIESPPLQDGREHGHGSRPEQEPRTVGPNTGPAGSRSQAGSSTRASAGSGARGGSTSRGGSSTKCPSRKQIAQRRSASRSQARARSCAGMR